MQRSSRFTRGFSPFPWAVFELFLGGGGGGGEADRDLEKDELLQAPFKALAGPIYM